MAQPSQTAVMTKSKRHCQFQDCSRVKTYGSLGGTAQFCSRHKGPQDVDLKHKLCEAEACQRHPYYGRVGQKPQFCSLHKTVSMTNLRSRRCQHEDCQKQASYALANSQNPRVAQYCAEHKREGMVDVTNRKCGFNGCRVNRMFDKRGHRRRFCAVHNAGQDGAPFQQVHPQQYGQDQGGVTIQTDGGVAMHHHHSTQYHHGIQYQHPEGIPQPFERPMQSTHTHTHLLGGPFYYTSPPPRHPSLPGVIPSPLLAPLGKHRRDFSDMNASHQQDRDASTQQSASFKSARTSSDEPRSHTNSPNGANRGIIRGTSVSSNAVSSIGGSPALQPQEQHQVHQVWQDRRGDTGGAMCDVEGLVSTSTITNTHSTHMFMQPMQPLLYDGMPMDSRRGGVSNNSMQTWMYGGGSMVFHPFMLGMVSPSAYMQQHQAQAIGGRGLAQESIRPQQESKDPDNNAIPREQTERSTSGSSSVGGPEGMAMRRCDSDVSSAVCMLPRFQESAALHGCGPWRIMEASPSYRSTGPTRVVKSPDGQQQVTGAIQIQAVGDVPLPFLTTQPLQHPHPQNFSMPNLWTMGSMPPSQNSPLGTCVSYRSSRDGSTDESSARSDSFSDRLASDASQCSHFSATPASPAPPSGTTISGAPLLLVALYPVFRCSYLQYSYPKYLFTKLFSVGSMVAYKY